MINLNKVKYLQRLNNSYGYVKFMMKKFQEFLKSKSRRPITVPSFLYMYENESSHHHEIHESCFIKNKPHECRILRIVNQKQQGELQRRQFGANMRANAQSFGDDRDINQTWDSFCASCYMISLMRMLDLKTTWINKTQTWTQPISISQSST